MEVKAKARYIRMSPRKVRLVADMVRGKKVTVALNTLEFCKRWSARPILKLLNSAIANATHNFSLEKENLYIKTLKVDQGPMLKRWRARAFGRAAEIQKRMSHIIMVLDELEVKAPTAKALEKTEKTEKKVAKTEKTEKAVKTKTVKKLKKAVSK